MKRRLFSISTLSVILISASAFIKISSGGIIGVTGSPGETNCANCHGGGGGTTTVSVTATPAFSGNQYNPGQTYTVDVTVSNNLFTKFGFDCEILTLSSTNAGTMTTAFTGVQFANSGARKNATHTGPQSGSGSATFSFAWVAPASGTAKIFATGNAVNGDGLTSGDRPGSTILVLTANATGVADNIPSQGHPLSVFPNPVSGDFRMQYTLESEGKVKATLYNLSGQEVHTLFNDYQPTGLHSVSANIPANIPAGIYMVKLSVNGVHYAQHMLISQ
jgi:hypothetical protein